MVERVFKTTVQTTAVVTPDEGNDQNVKLWSQSASNSMKQETQPVGSEFEINSQPLLKWQRSNQDSMRYGDRESRMKDDPYGANLKHWKTKIVYIHYRIPQHNPKFCKIVFEFFKKSKKHFIF